MWLLYCTNLENNSTFTVDNIRLTWQQRGTNRKQLSILLLERISSIEKAHESPSIKSWNPPFFTSLLPLSTGTPIEL
jgi:hypothetical protein